MATQREISGAVKDVNAASGTASLGRLSDMHDFKVADGYPDIRGWAVQILDGSKVGKVDDLIVDTNAMRVRYVNVKLDRSVARDARDASADVGGDAEGRHTLLPIGIVALDERDDHVVVNGYTLAQLAMLPSYDGAVITTAYESSLRTALNTGSGTGRGTGGGTVIEDVAVDPATGQVAGVAVAENARGRVTGVATETGNLYDHPHYDDQRLYAARRKAASAQQDAGTQRITLAEEQLSVGKRQVSAGEAEIRKAVDTRHVQEQVAITREEVTVERRPLTDGAKLQPIGEDEISIPVMEEQLVVEKRMVPVEQIIVRKRQVTDQQTVDADLRRERLEIDDTTARSAGVAIDAGTTGATGTARPKSDR